MWGIPWDSLTTSLWAPWIMMPGPACTRLAAVGEGISTDCNFMISTGACTMHSLYEKHPSIYVLGIHQHRDQHHAWWIIFNQFTARYPLNWTSSLLILKPNFFLESSYFLNRFELATSYWSRKYKLLFIKTLRFFR